MQYMGVRRVFRCFIVPWWGNNVILWNVFFLSSLYHRTSLLINILIREPMARTIILSQYRMSSMLRAPQCLDWAVVEATCIFWWGNICAQATVITHCQFHGYLRFSLPFMSRIKGWDAFSDIDSMWVLSPLQQVALRHDGISMHLLPISLKRWGIFGKVLSK